MAISPKGSTQFTKLIAIMARLRGDTGCPWDREQTHLSLRKYLLEETYEVLEAIDLGDDQELRVELGDLLLQVFFHAQIASEETRFDIEDVIAAICDKLVRRHPNVFGDVEINTAEEQSINWERVKRAEKKGSVLEGVPKALSALVRARRIQQKAATVGFDWGATRPVLDKIDEEVAELKEAVSKMDDKAITDEFGDILFSMVNISRFLNVDPEDALRGTVEKFIRRFEKVESFFENRGKSLADCTLEEMDTVWTQIKGVEKETS
jgi:tetrapyrrole methylase family protein/MazG family protein